MIERIKGYYAHRGLKWPSSEEALLWLISEIGELVDAYWADNPASSHVSAAIFRDAMALGEWADEYLAEKGGWIRNNDPSKSLGKEVADVLMMLYVFAVNVNMDPEDELVKKMKEKGYED